MSEYPFNPAYYQAHKDICKRRDTKRLYFNPLRIYLPHGRGAGATSFCVIEAILAIEKSVIENQKPQKPKRKLLYHTAEQNDTSKLRNVLVIIPEESYVRGVMYYFYWALEKLNLERNYSISMESRTLTRKGTKNKIQIVTADRMRGMILNKFSFFVIDEASSLSPTDFYWIQDWITGQQTSQNNIILVSYNPKFEDDWLGTEGFYHAGEGNYRFYHADYRTMPKAWLGKRFFKQAKLLRESNPKLYSEAFLGLPYLRIRNVPHGTLQGKKTIAGKQKNKTTKKEKQHGQQCNRKGC